MSMKDVPRYLYEAQRNLELAISSTPTGPLRNMITDANITVMTVQKHVEELNRAKEDKR